MTGAATIRRAYRAALVVGVVHLPIPAPAQVLDLPPRPADAPGGSVIAREIHALDLEAREARILAEIGRGNVPGWLRQLRTVEMVREVSGRSYRVTFRVIPDYLAVGSRLDSFLVPLSPSTAQRVADLVGASLPTPVMVDAIWEAAAVRLTPQPIPPSPAMTTVSVFAMHNRMVGWQRRRHPARPGALVAGHKKDVVLSSQLDTRPGRVAIYGWHGPDGWPIQPLYTGHASCWVDYSHGIRLVHRIVTVNGVPWDLRDLLTDPVRAAAVTDGSVMAAPTPAPRLAPCR